MTTNKFQQFFFIAIAIIVSISLYFLFSYLIKNEIQSKQEVQRVPGEDIILLEDDNELKKFLDDSSIENQKRYIENVDKKISNPNLSQRTKNDLLLRKAITMSVVRGNSSYRNEASEILKYFIKKDERNEISEYQQDFSIIAFSHLHFQCCETRPFSKEFPEESEKYKSLGFDDNASKLIILNELLKKVSTERKDDTALIANSMLVKAQIIDLYVNKAENRNEEINQVMNNLKKDLKNFKDSKPKTFKDKMTTEIEPLILYAYAYDMFYSYKDGLSEKISKETNDQIDKNYIFATNELNKHLLEKNSDVVAIKLMLLYNSVRQIKSMERRYPDDSKKDEIKLIAKNVIDLINSQREVKLIADNYFKNNQGPGTNMGYFVSLAKKYDTIKKYMDSINVKS